MCVCCRKSWTFLEVGLLRGEVLTCGRCSVHLYNWLILKHFVFVCVSKAPLICVHTICLRSWLQHQVLFSGADGEPELDGSDLWCVRVSPVWTSLFPLKEEDFQEMVKTAQMMESQYGHLFEKIIVNDELSAASSELQLALEKVENEPHWVPVSWTHSWGPPALWQEKREELWQKYAGVLSFCGWFRGIRKSNEAAPVSQHLSWAKDKRFLSFGLDLDLCRSLDVVLEFWVDLTECESWTLIYVAVWITKRWSLVQARTWKDLGPSHCQSVLPAHQQLRQPRLSLVCISLDH